jgi:phosphatidylglycerophosphate synthase
MLSKLRDLVHPLRRLLAWPFIKAGASPTFVSATGVVLAALAACLARAGWNTAAFWTAAAALLTDMADGEVARQTDRCSPSGNYIDAMGDRVSECLLLLGLLQASPNLAGLALAGACLTSFAKARCALVLSMDNRDWPGVGDYPDRAALLLLAYLLLPDPTFPLALLVLTSWSCLWRRTQHALSLVRQASPDELQPYLRGSARYQR